MQAANRVVLNTGVLYGKMALTMVISLYSSRLVLNALGAIDFGIFNLISGIILMLSFLNVSMTVSTQRYLSFYLGAGEHHKLQTVFNTSIILHLVIGIAIVILLELSGTFLFKNIINIPEESKRNAIVIFHFMIVSTFFTIISVPYDAIINSNENMIVVAIIDIFQSIIKLSIAILLIYIVKDKIIIYGALMAMLEITIMIIKRFVCHKKYNESKLQLKKYLSKSLFIEMFTFSGWNFLGAISNVAKSQGMALVLNVFFGAIINASYAIANQVNSQLSFFSVTMLKALNPQIAISEGKGDRKRMLNLAMIASKFAFLLFSFFGIPLIIEMPYVLTVWLKNVPENSVAFCRLISVITLINLLSVGIQTAIQTVGRIKKYQIGVSILLILNLPLAYLLLKNGLPATSVFMGSIILEIIIFIFRLIASRRLTKMPIACYVNYVVLRPLIIIFIVSIISVLPLFLMNQCFFRFLTTVGLSSISFLSIVIIIGLSSYEKEKISNILQAGLLSIRQKIVRNPSL